MNKKGNSLQVQSDFMFRSRKPKQRGKRMWTTAALPAKDKQKVYIARKEK